MSEGEDVESFHQLLVDGDVYAVTSDSVLRYFSGRRSGFDIPDPPDAGDIRPGHDYRFIGATGSRGVGNMYVWDAENGGRILVFDKTDGTYVGQFVSAPGAPPLSDVTGMYVIDPGTSTAPPVLMYVRPDGVYRLVLAEPDSIPSTPPVTAAPTGTTPVASPTTGASEQPASPTPEPTRRPRRTPRPN